MGLRLSTNKENRVSSCSTLPEASERYQVLSQSCLSMTSERWENNFEGSKPQSFPVSRSRHQIKKYARDYYVAGQYFFDGAAYSFLLRGAAFTPPRPKIPRTAPKICLPNQILLEPAPLFIGAKKGVVFRPLLICKLFVKISYLWITNQFYYTMIQIKNHFSISLLTSSYV